MTLSCTVLLNKSSEFRSTLKWTILIIDVFSNNVIIKDRVEFLGKCDSIFSIKWKMMDISVLFSLTFSNFKNVKLWMHDKWSSRHTHLFCWTRKISFFFDVMSWVKKKVFRGGRAFPEGGLLGLSMLRWCFFRSVHWVNPLLAICLKSTLFENHQKCLIFKKCAFKNGL